MSSYYDIPSEVVTTPKYNGFEIGIFAWLICSICEEWKEYLHSKKFFYTEKQIATARSANFPIKHVRSLLSKMQKDKFIAIEVENGKKYLTVTNIDIFKSIEMFAQREISAGKGE